jgi:hypothetical protein
MATKVYAVGYMKCNGEIGFTGAPSWHKDQIDQKVIAQREYVPELELFTVVIDGETAVAA